MDSQFSLVFLAVSFSEVASYEEKYFCIISMQKKKKDEEIILKSPANSECVTVDAVGQLFFSVVLKVC